MKSAKIIRVTGEHIAKGIRNDVYSCPIALALKEQLGGEPCAAYDRIYLGSTESRLARRGKLFQWHMPRSGRRFMHRFDSGKPVKPFNFILRGSG